MSSIPKISISRKSAITVAMVVIVALVMLFSFLWGPAS